MPRCLCAYASLTRATYRKSPQSWQTSVGLPFFQIEGTVVEWDEVRFDVRLMQRYVCFLLFLYSGVRSDAECLRVWQGAV